MGGCKAKDRRSLTRGGVRERRVLVSLEGGDGRKPSATMKESEVESSLNMFGYETRDDLLVEMVRCDAVEAVEARLSTLWAIIMRVLVHLLRRPSVASSLLGSQSVGG